MATPIKRIEKEFLLKVIYDENIPIMYLRDRSEFIFNMIKSTKEELSFKSSRPVPGLKAKKKIDLIFDYRGQVISFAAEVLTVKDDIITTAIPESLYKNLDRSYSRVQTPSDLSVHFTFLGDRYSLTYPKVREYSQCELNDFMLSLNPVNLSNLIDQMASWIKGFANGYKLIIFKDVKPTSIEELLMAETGKAFYLPSTYGSLPAEDPYPKGRLITEEIFKRYLESTGVDISFVNEASDRFIKAKLDNGVFSDLWVPILFQEYIIGYVHIWINSQDKLPFDHSVIDTLYQYGTVLANSLEINGYFENGKVKNESFEGKVMDISASGLLFVNPNNTISAYLMPNIELALKLITPRRTVNTNARIVRKFKDSAQGYFGVRFLDMAPEDMRFLFEYIYGKTFNDDNAGFITGQV